MNKKENEKNCYKRLGFIRNKKIKDIIFEEIKTYIDFEKLESYDDYNKIIQLEKNFYCICIDISFGANNGLCISFTKEYEIKNNKIL